MAGCCSVVLLLLACCCCCFVVADMLLVAALTCCCLQRCSFNFFISFLNPANRVLSRLGHGRVRPQVCLFKPCRTCLGIHTQGCVGPQGGIFLYSSFISLPCFLLSFPFLQAQVSEFPTKRMRIIFMQKTIVQCMGPIRMRMNSSEYTTLLRISCRMQWCKEITWVYVWIESYLKGNSYSLNE